MTIVFLLTGTAMGGAEKQVLDLARKLQSRGHAVALVSLTPLGPVAEEARAAGLRIESLGMPRGLPDPRGVVRLVSLLRQLRPDVVHSHLFHANVLARVIRPWATMPVLVCTIHSANVRSRVWARVYRLTDRWADLTTIISRVAATRHIEAGAVGADRLTVVPNGIDVHRFQVMPEARADLRRRLGLGSDFVWLAVGRYQPDKDYPTLLRAFAALVRERPDAQLLIAGEGPGRPEAEQQIRDLGIVRAVHLLGLRSDVPQLLNAADGYVMSSAWEGLPLVLLEAAAVGLPIVSTEVGGVAEVVRDGESGFLVPPGDAIALAKALRRVMDLDASERQCLGQRGRAHVTDHFGLDQVVTQWERIYGDLLGQRKT